MANVKWSEAGFVQQATVALTDDAMGLVGGVNSKFTLTVLQTALTKVGVVSVTQPATAATLTLADGSTLVTSGANSITLTSTGATNVTLPTTGTLMANPMTTGGDIIYGGASGAPTRLANGTAGKVLTSAGTTLAPTWETPAGGGDVTASGTLTANQIIIGGGTTVVSALGSLGTTTTVLHGNAAGAPTFGAVNLATDVTGALAWAINAQTGTTYTIDAADNGKLVTFNNAAAVAVTVPQATGSFTTGFSFTVQNIGAGLVTMTPTTSTVDTATSLVVPQGTGASWASDGTNWNTARGAAGGIRILPVPTVDGTAIGPVTRSFVSGYTSSAIGDLVILDSSFKWQKTDANTESLFFGMLGIALEVKATDAALLVALPGSFVYSTAFPTLSAGPIYMSETPGAVTQTRPSTADSATKVIGYGVHADKLFFHPEPSQLTHV